MQHDYILSTDAARGIQRKHSKLMRDLDRIKSMLPPEQSVRLFQRVSAWDKDGREMRAYRIPREALVLLFMGQASKVAVMWAVSALANRHETPY